VIKYISPFYLLIVFGFWCYSELIAVPAEPTKLPRLEQIRESRVVQVSIGFMLIVGLLILLLVGQSVKRWEAAERAREGEEVRV